MDNTLSNIISAIAVFVAIMFSCLNLWNAKKAQQQYVRISLLEKRYDVYLLLRKWYSYAERLIEENDVNIIELIFTWGDAELKRLATVFYKSGKSLSRDGAFDNVQSDYVHMKLYFHGVMQEERYKLGMIQYLYLGDNFDAIEKFTDTFFDVVKNMQEKDDVSCERLSKLKDTLVELAEDDVLDDMAKQIKKLKDLL